MTAAFWIALPALGGAAGIATLVIGLRTLVIAY